MFSLPVWTEPSAGLVDLVNDMNSSSRLPSPAVVSSVEEGSIGDELGFQPGDRLISINGVRPRDLIDYRLLVADDELHLEVLDSKGQFHKVDIEKEDDDGLGLEFTDALFDGLRQCNNHCSFCFIDQQPPGKRDSLYLKDDDYRLSFLYGSYLTLTNLKASDWQRIEVQRLSPLFVSVHATNSLLRSQLLNNPHALFLMDQLDWFAERNLQIHAQVVVCPGLNDGRDLDNTLNDLANYGTGDLPTILSAAVVPVGLTRFRPGGDGLIPVDKACAEKVIVQVEQLQQKFKSYLGSRFAWLSDEWYLIAQQPLPSKSSYEDFPQKENGVGSIRSFLKEIELATSCLPKQVIDPRRFSWVVGRLVAHALLPAVERFNAIAGVDLRLYGLPSPYWGQDQVVTGLLTGQDLVQGLEGADLGDHLLLPSVMLRNDEPVFLDDMTLEELVQALAVPISIVHGADEIVAVVVGDG